MPFFICLHYSFLLRISVARSSVSRYSTTTTIAATTTNFLFLSVSQSLFWNWPACLVLSSKLSNLFVFRLSPFSLFYACIPALSFGRSIHHTIPQTKNNKSCFLGKEKRKKLFCFVRRESDFYESGFSY